MTKTECGSAKFVCVTAQTVRDELAATIAHDLRGRHEPFKELYWRVAEELTSRNDNYIVTPGQISRVHHKAWKDVPAHLADNIRALAAVTKSRAREAERRVIAAERNQISELRREIEIMRERLNAVDADFHGADIEALGQGLPRRVEDTEQNRRIPRRKG